MKGRLTGPNDPYRNRTSYDEISGDQTAKGFS